MPSNLIAFPSKEGKVYQKKHQIKILWNVIFFLVNNLQLNYIQLLMDQQNQNTIEREFGNGKLKIISMVQKEHLDNIIDVAAISHGAKHNKAAIQTFFIIKIYMNKNMNKKVILYTLSQAFMIAKKNAHEFKINIKQHQFKHFKHLQKLHLEWIDRL
ncbi:unnamed protein product [Paramecium sonneborni]|uniref:Uncharacterized protein n=1 Tax=Paramecium sonneborni TaxID=65129 RepID=A0A8S1RSQ0_9CILI|nr:unnamed protein product [Paramecium sonneborni]